jgi:hypothetical protein
MLFGTDFDQMFLFQMHSIRYACPSKYIHVLGFCLTNKTDFGFDDRIYWTFYTTCLNISQITVFDWRLSTSDHTILIPSSWSQSQSQSQSHVTTDCQSASLSWCQAPIWGLRPLFITVRHLQACWCGALSLTRERVCRLQLLLVLAEQTFLEPSLTGLVTIFYCLGFETSSPWRARFPYLYPPGRGWPSYISRHWVPFSSSPTTRGAQESLTVT